MVHSRSRTPSQVFRLQSFSFQHCLHTTPATICIRKTPLTATPTFIISGLQLLNGWHIPGIFLSILHICTFLLTTPCYYPHCLVTEMRPETHGKSICPCHTAMLTRRYFPTSIYALPDSPSLPPQTLYSSTLSAGHVTIDSGLTRCMEYCRKLWNCSSTDQQFLNP